MAWHQTGTYCIEFMVWTNESMVYLEKYGVVQICVW